MRLLKKTASIAMCVVLLLGLWGCGGKELYERLLIHGIGVDADGDGFLVTVRSSISPEDEGEEFFRCRGDSVLEALNSLTLSTGRKPFYAHNYLVVFGEACARQGLDRCLDFFIRYYNTRPSVKLFLAEGRAEEILSAQKDGTYLKMGELQQIGGSGKDNGRAVDTEILDFVNGVKREGSSPVAPVLRALEDGGVEVASTAYFDGYRLKGFLSPDQTRGYLAAKNRLENGEAVVSGEDLGQVTLSLSGVSGTVEAEEVGGNLPGFIIRVRVRADVSALDRGRDKLEEALYVRAEEELSGLLREEIEGALEQTVQKDRCDIFGFGALLYRRDPSRWREIAGDWEEKMAQCAYRVEVTAGIQRLEQETGGQFM